MEKTCFYNLKDILMGLKGEYEKHIKELEELKSYVLLSENNFDNIYFWIHQNQKNARPEMFCTMEKCGFQMTLKVDEYNIGTQNYPKLFNSKEFLDKYHSIMNSKYVRNMYIENILNVDNCINPCLNIKQNSIEIINNYDNPNILYKPYFDKCTNKIVNELVISLYTKRNKVLTEKMIENIFESKFWIDSFPVYHTKIIDNNAQEKPIIVYGSPIILDNNNVKYRILEDEDYYALKKTLR